MNRIRTVTRLPRETACYYACMTNAFDAWTKTAPRAAPSAPAVWLVSLRPGVPLFTDPIDVDLPGMPRGFYTILEGHPRADGGWDVELVSAELFTRH